MEPMLLRPAGKDYLWGGTRLKTEYGKMLDMKPLAETWECSTHKDGSSVVANGRFAGKALAEVIRKYPEYLGKKHQGKKELPILVKFIDAEQNLSIQVHPDDAYAWKHERQPGKTELWYILDAKPGAKIIYGFEHEVTREILEEAVRTGEFMKHLHLVPVSKGDVFYIPPGTVHAVGAGVLLVEVQQSSNATYRIYDYDRIDKYGNKRELHFDKAVQVMNMKPTKEIKHNSRLIKYGRGYSSEFLCQCEFFKMDRVQVNDQFSFSMDDTSFLVLLCLEGNGVLHQTNKQRGNVLSKGSCFFIPAKSNMYSISGHMTVLKIHS